MDYVWFIAVFVPTFAVCTFVAQRHYRMTLEVPLDEDDGAGAEPRWTGRCAAAALAAAARAQRALARGATLGSAALYRAHRAGVRAACATRSGGRTLWARFSR